jgi:hypothetical protein
LNFCGFARKTRSLDGAEPNQRPLLAIEVVQSKLTNVRLGDLLLCVVVHVRLVSQSKLIELDGDAAFRIRHGSSPWSELVATVHAQACRARYFWAAPQQKSFVLSDNSVRLTVGCDEVPR